MQRRIFVAIWCPQRTGLQSRNRNDAEKGPRSSGNRPHFGRRHRPLCPNRHIVHLRLPVWRFPSGGRNVVTTAVPRWPRTAAGLSGQPRGVATMAPGAGFGDESCLTERADGSFRVRFRILGCTPGPLDLVFATRSSPCTGKASKYGQCELGPRVSRYRPAPKPPARSAQPPPAAPPARACSLRSGRKTKGRGRPNLVGMSAAMTRRGWALFIAVGVIWGLPYLLIRVSVREVSPAFLVLVRTGGGALLLAPFVVRRGAVAPLLARWKAIAVFTLVELAVPWWVLFNGERKITSSLAGLLVAAVPISGAVIARVTGTDQLDKRRALGLFLGVAGVGALVGFDVGSSDLLAASSFLLVVIGYSLGPWILSRYLSDLPRRSVITASLGLCAVVYAPLGRAATTATFALGFGDRVHGGVDGGLYGRGVHCLFRLGGGSRPDAFPGSHVREPSCGGPAGSARAGRALRGCDRHWFRPRARRVGPGYPPATSGPGERGYDPVRARLVRGCCGYGRAYWRGALRR